MSLFHRSNRLSTARHCCMWAKNQITALGKSCVAPVDFCDTVFPMCFSPSAQTLLFKTKSSLTLDFSWCSSIWMSVSLVLSSSLAACRATIRASGFSPLLRPFFDIVSYQRESTCSIISNTDCHVFLFLSVPVSSAPTVWHSLRSWTLMLWKPCEK